jgi:short-subunit dehydrogenase
VPGEDQPGPGVTNTAARYGVHFFDAPVSGSAGPAQAGELHGTGVRVTCIGPGLADTEFSTIRFSGDKAKADAVYKGMQPLTADDIAESVYWAATLPPHVNVNTIELMPVAQSFAAFQVARDNDGD